MLHHYVLKPTVGPSAHAHNFISTAPFFPFIISLWTGKDKKKKYDMGLKSEQGACCPVLGRKHAQTGRLSASETHSFNCLPAEYQLRLFCFTRWDLSLEYPLPRAQTAQHRQKRGKEVQEQNQHLKRLLHHMHTTN